MPYCSKCATESAGNFCGTCGAPIGAAGTPGGAPPQPPPLSSSSGLDQNMAAALCYLAGIYAVVISVLSIFYKPLWKGRKIYEQA
jgi:hypothetical protein